VPAVEVRFNRSSFNYFVLKKNYVYLIANIIKSFII
jgi:hypothetical protein